MAKKSDSKNDHSSKYPPVIVVLGHVDHGKTTLLDTIRKSNIAAREQGGITQKIGASRIEIDYEGARRAITFIDTPGHAAFSHMRSRGAQVAEIGLLIVAATEGVKPQTKESIVVLQNAKIPIIVVLTKSDLPTKNVEKVKQEIIKEGILLEGYGGDTPVIEVSAKTGLHIKELLELILLVYDLKYQKILSPQESLKAIVIESRLDRRIGPLATVIVKTGKLSIKDELSDGSFHAKVKALINDRGKHIHEATIGDAVEILGFEEVPRVGSIMYKKSEISITEPTLALEKTPMHTLSRQERMQIVPEKPFFYQKEENRANLSLLICADTEGSLEAIITMLPKEIQIISQKTGDVSEKDIFLAKASKAIVVGFNTKLRPDVLKLASQEKVLVKNYQIIYELIDEITDVLEGKKIMLEERILGVAKILATFPFEKTKVLGITVVDGRVAKGDKARIERGETVVGEGTITSVRHGKEAISKLEKGQEGGLIITPLLDFTIGDMVLSIG